MWFLNLRRTLEIEILRTLLKHRGKTCSRAGRTHHNRSYGWRDWRARVNASSKKATACSRETEGNPSRK